MNKKKKIYYLDILRAIACLSVIMIHSSAHYVLNDFGSPNFWVGNILDSLSRIGVPLFVMISGALMLDENYYFSIKKLIQHIIKMIIFFIFWSIVYCITFQIILNEQPFNIIKFIKAFIEGNYHLWFVYLIVGIYLIVPLLRVWIKDENKKYVEYFIILSIIFTYIIPQIISIGCNYSNIFNLLNTIIKQKLHLEYVGGYTTYFILGWYLNNYGIKNKKIIYILGIIGLIITIFGTYIVSYSTGKIIPIYDYLTLNVLLQSLAIFIFIKTKYVNVENTKNKFINAVSKNSLGIYAIHAGVITIIYRNISKIGFNLAIVNIPFIFLISFTLSFLGSYIMSKVPFLKRVV